MKRIKLFEVVALVIFLMCVIFFLGEKNIFKTDTDRLIDLNKKESVDLIQLSPPNLKVYHSINKYAPQNGVPFKYAFGIVREETGYKNPLDYRYTHSQTSPTGAEGPFQFILSTARYIAKDRTLSRSEVRYNTELNARLSMEYARKLYRTYNNWNLAFGFYNTGYPVINSYALRITARS